MTIRSYSCFCRCSGESSLPQVAVEGELEVQEGVLFLCELILHVARSQPFLVCFG